MAPSTELKGGSVTIMGGMARYACASDQHLVVEGKVVQAASFVRWCTEAGDWRPWQVPTCEPWVGKVDALPRTKKVMTDLTNTMPLSLLQQGSKQEQDGEDIQAPSSIKAPEVNASIPPPGSSFIEMGSNAQQMQHSANRGTQRSSAKATRDGVETSMRASAKVNSGNREQAETWSGSVSPGVLHIHPWRIEFTKDATHRFSVDTCWITWTCANGQVPDDAAASSLYAYSPSLHEKQIPWSVVFAAGAGVVVSLAVMAVVTKGSRSDSSSC
jgi:hypothetical protein